MWNDTNADPPKRYSYAEWAYYLRLLGEDENDSRFHRKPPKKAALDDLEERKKEAKNRSGHAVGNIGLTTAGQAKRKDSMTKWSWMGPRSPLMAGDDEPSWLLEKLFAKLETSLQEHWDEHKAQDRLQERASQDDAGHEDDFGGSDHRQSAGHSDEGQYEGVEKESDQRRESQ